MREHPAVRPITAEHLAEAAAATNFSQTSNSANTGIGADGVLRSPDANIQNNNGNGQSSPTKPRKVMLAPFGMAATLTGNSYKATDPLAEKFLEEFASFFPLCNKESTDLPPVVEVVTGKQIIINKLCIIGFIV